MIFTEDSDDPEKGLFCRATSEDGSVEIGVYRVLYGFRVRAGFTNSQYVELDWCCGADWRQVELFYSIMLAILMKREKSRYCFEGIPTMSQIKPAFNDVSFMRTIANMATDIPEISLCKNTIELHTKVAALQAAMEELRQP